MLNLHQLTDSKVQLNINRVNNNKAMDIYEVLSHIFVHGKTFIAITLSRTAKVLVITLYNLYLACQHI